MERNSTRSFVSTSRWLKQPKPSTRAERRITQRNSCETPIIFKTAFKTPTQRQVCYSTQRARLTENINDCFDSDFLLPQKLTFEKVTFSSYPAIVSKAVHSPKNTGQIIDHLFGSPQSASAELSLRGDSEELKALLDELQTHVSQCKASQLGECSPSYLKDNINVLIRQVGKYYQSHQNKETAYVFYWFLISLIWNVDQLQKITNETTEQHYRHSVEQKVKHIEEKLRADFETQLRETEKKYRDEIISIEGSYKTTKARLVELEQETAIKEQEYYSKMSEVATSPIMEGLERTYGKVREAINQTYDNEFQQFKYLQEYFKITKDLAVKVKEARNETAVQTDLSFNEYESCMRLHINALTEGEIKGTLPPVMKFLNTVLQKYPDKDLKGWDEIYRDSEQILSSRNFPTDSNGNEQFNIHNAVLYHFLNKHPDSTETAANSLFSYLNTISKNETLFPYANYLSTLLGMNKKRALTPIELSTFIKKRNKLLSKYWGNQGIPTMEAQIPFTDVVNFIIEAFSKQLPQVGSMALSFLYLINNRNNAKTFGYTYLESSPIVTTYFKKKGAETTCDLEAFVSKHVFLMHTLNVLLKDLRVQMRVAFEKDDKTDTGIARKEIFQDLLRKIAPIGMCEEDEECILKIFSSKDGFEYKEFLELLNAVDALKPAECVVPLFGICHAMLIAIIKNHDNGPRNLSVELQHRLGVDHLPKGFRDILMLLQLLPKDIGVGLHDGAYVYNVLHTECKDLGINSLSEVVWKLAKLNKESETQANLLNVGGIFGRKELGTVSRKAGLTEYAKSAKKTPLSGARSPAGNGNSNRRAVPLSPSSFADAAKGFSAKK